MKYSRIFLLSEIIAKECTICARRIGINKYLFLTFIAVFWISSAAFTQDLGKVSSKQELNSDIISYTIKDVMIPVDDTKLRGRLYRPNPVDKPRPTIFLMTPFTVDEPDQNYGRYFAMQGYAYLDVEIRGQRASDKLSQPLFGDGKDGAVIAEWITRQSWNNGQVAMRGASYHGMVQWQTLTEGAGTINTIVPAASVYPGWNFPSLNGVFYSYTAQWLALVKDRTSQSSLFFDNEYWSNKNEELHLSGKAFSELDDITGLSLQAAEIFQRWIEHPNFDDYWRSASPNPADYRDLDLPILTITGYFDADQSGSLRYYRQHMQYGSDEGKQQHYLLMGPWNHTGTDQPTKELNSLVFADTAAIDVNHLHQQWFDWVLKDENKPRMLQDRIVYYVMGADQWRTAPALKSVADTERTLYLQSPDKNPDDPFDAGDLTIRQPKSAEVDQYVYDPRNPADISSLDHYENNYTAPGAAFLNGPKLVYHSAPVEESFEMSGHMHLDAWIELNVSDTDLAAWVYEIRPNEKTIYLGKTWLRARHRNGMNKTRLAVPGTIERYRFDRFNWTSRQIQKGSYIRLVIAPLNDPNWQKNYNSGKSVMQQTIEDAQTATVKLHIGPDHPSKLILPVRTDENSK